MSRRILIVDDDPSLRVSLSDALREEGYHVSTAESGASSLAMFGDARPDVVLCDVRMPEMDGLVLLRTLRDRAPRVDVVLMTAYDDMDTVVTAMRGGAVEFLVKPVGLDNLLAVMSRVFEDRRERNRAGRLEEEPRDRSRVRLGDLVGRAPSMIALYKLVGQAASSRVTVLIRGESGTGKEVVARAIHSHSVAAREPFVPVNCAAIPNTLLESELFGHVRGAFTGAHDTRRGRFALAGSGTIFLDEIGDTSPDLQSKLLRVIQDREYQPVGSERTEQSNARVIAATHQNLERMIGDNRFRQDLYYRLRVVEIIIPPLRERMTDVPLLVDHMLRRAATNMATPVPVLSAEAAALLSAHSWPGNVRELENCVTRAAVIASGNVIHAEHLSIGSLAETERPPLLSLQEVEREQIIRVLAATNGHRSRTASILGVSRPRLQRLMQKYGLE